MRVLNLYSGLGGNRKHWKDVEVVAVEKTQAIAGVYARQFPDDQIVIGDAHEYLINNYEDFDFIWSSPPCQSHSRMNKATRHKERRYPEMALYQEIIFLQHFFKGKYVVENVSPYYEPLIQAQKVGRHLFWTNLDLTFIQDVKRPEGFINKSNLEGKQELMDWLGIQFEENIYYEGNHCPCQVLRNCVHPDLGLDIFKEALAA